MSNKNHDYQKYAHEYAALGFEGTLFLAVRDVPALLHKYARGNKALDYGCGPGRTTRFLKKLGLTTVGVDISPDMLKEASLRDPSGEYRHIQSGQLPFADASIDIIFSSFVLVEVPTVDEIAAIMAEMNRVLKPDGIIMIVTATLNHLKAKWVSLDYDFPENDRPIQSGDTVKVFIRGTNVTLYDYYWTEQDYAQAFQQAGLQIIQADKPLGHAEDPFEWQDEKEKAALLIYTLSKAPTTA